MTPHGPALLRRIVREYRRILVPLAVLFAVDVLAYALVVRPLADRVANVEQREQQAERDLAAAKEDYAQAAGTLTGKDRAARELDTYYRSVLPRDLRSARDLTLRRLPTLAGQLKVVFDNRSTPIPKPQRDSALVRLESEVGLAGRYNDLRTLIHQLETSPEFVVIDTIELEEGDEEAGLLEVTLYLSTYYRATE